MMTVACVWVAGHVPYSADYVTRLQAMVTAHLDRPFRFVCLTDRPSEVPGVDTVSVPTPMLGVKGWWAKLELFNPARDWPGRVLYLDLDTLVVGPLGPILDYPAPFALVPDAGTFVAPKGLSIVKRFNSSVMVWDRGVTEPLWQRFEPSITRRLHGDQDWIGEQMPEAAAMPLAWFPRLSTVPEGPPFDALVKVVLSKVPKNHIAAQKIPWFAPLWGAA